MTRNLARSEWVNDERGVEAVKAEATGLRANDTWDNTSAQPFWMLKQQAAKENRRIKIAHLRTLCGLKNFELGPSHYKYKGRIVLRVLEGAISGMA